jgi:hypothetical protein
MNISQPFIHHPIATSLQFHHRCKRSDYRRGAGPIRVRDIGQAIPGLRDITLTVSPWEFREVGSLIGR